MTHTAIGILAWALLTLAGPSTAAQESAPLIEQGRAAFTRVGCGNCHAVRGTGSGIASDLSRIGTKYGIVYLERWLRDPREVHPSGHMPAIELVETDIQALAAFLAAQR